MSISLMTDRREATTADHWRGALDGASPCLLAEAVGRAPRTHASVDARRSVGTSGVRLGDLTSDLDTTPSILVHAAWAVVLANRLATRDVVFATATAAVAAPGVEPATAIGLVRVPVDRLSPVRSLMATVADALADARRHSAGSLSDLAAHTDVDLDALCDTVIVDDDEGDGAAGRWHLEGAIGIDAFPTIVGTGTGSDLHVSVTMSDPQTPWMADDLVGHLLELIGAMVAAPDTPTGSLPTMALAEQHRLLVDWNPAPTPYAAHVPIHGAVRVHAANQPDAVAVSDGCIRLTYGELDAAADRLTAWLRDHGVERGDRVGLLCGRNPSFAVGTLGILRAGAAYAPIDPAYPDDRIAFMLADSGAGLLITDGVAPPPASWQGPVVALPSIPSDHPIGPEVEVGPDDLAYIVYTSGSTGRPKGVLVEHGSLTNLVRWNIDEYHLGPGDRCSLIACTAFDGSVWELWPTLASGATLCVIPERARLVPDELAAWLREAQIDWTFLPTPMAESLLANPEVGSIRLRTCMTGGDRLRVRPEPGLGFELINHYGPTEATVLTSSGKVLPLSLDQSLPSIGTAIANTRMVVLDPSTCELVPTGVVGELFIGGVGVARGYHDRPQLDAERFVTLALPGLEPARYYRSGDLVRWRSDATMEFVGRSDEQIQLRGYRIELGEIEATLLRDPALASAAVILAEGPTGSELHAIVIAADPARVPTARQVRRRLMESLPSYMVPSVVEIVDEIALTPNGKIDRRALAVRAAARTETADS